MKKIVSIMLFVIFSFSLAVPALGATNSAFSDVAQSHWAYSYIMRAYEDNVMTGTYYDAATGERRFSPDATLTMPELITIVTRAFYADEVEASTATGAWYAKNEEVANAHNLLDGILGANVMSYDASRYLMAVVMRNVMADKGAQMPTEAELEATQARIADWSSISFGYREPVATVFYLNIITGVDSVGTFDGSSTMNRATAATVYCRLADAIASLTDEPDDPIPTPTPTPTPSSDAVGTISEEKVTLSLETHMPVTDYWSEQSAEIRGLTNKDAYNALCQTLADTELITSGDLVSAVNEYYNYAVYATDSSDQKNMNVNAVCNILSNCGATYGARLMSSAGLTFFRAAPFNSDLTAVLDPIVEGIPAGASDREIVEYCVQAVVDRFDYETSGGFTWLNGKTTGDCDDYSTAIAQLLSEAGIPSIQCGGTVTGGNHAWLQVYIRNGSGNGSWYVVDGPAADVGYSKILTFAEHEKLYGYDDAKNNTERLIVARSVVETIWG